MVRSGALPDNHNSLLDSLASAQRSVDGMMAPFRAMSNWMGQVERIGGIHPVQDVGTGVISGFQQVLNNPKRNDGEFNMAIGEKQGALAASTTWFTPGVKMLGHEVNFVLGAPELQANQHRVLAVMHTHPMREHMGTNQFSVPDIQQANALQESAGKDQTVRSYLLTPDNKLLVYTPNERRQHPNGEEAGHFDKQGNFVLTNKRYEFLRHS